MDGVVKRFEQNSWGSMNRLTLEAAWLLEAAFGPELKGGLILRWPDKLGYHKARAVVLANSTPRDVTPEIVKRFIRECLAAGLRGLPKGWSLIRHEESSNKLELVVWAEP